MDRKTFLCIFSCWFSVRFREITLKKCWRNKRVLLSKQKASFFLPEQSKPLVNLMILLTLFFKNRENQRQNTEKCFPINLQLTCWKLDKSEQK